MYEHPAVHIKYMQFLLYQFYLNKACLKIKKISNNIQNFDTILFLLKIAPHGARGKQPLLFLETVSSRREGTACLTKLRCQREISN